MELTDVSKETKIGFAMCVSGDNADIISLFSLLFHVAIFSNELEGTIELTPENIAFAMPRAYSQFIVIQLKESKDNPAIHCVFQLKQCLASICQLPKINFTIIFVNFVL